MGNQVPAATQALHWADVPIDKEILWILEQCLSLSYGQQVPGHFGKMVDVTRLSCWERFKGQQEFAEALFWHTPVVPI